MNIVHLIPIIISVFLMGIMLFSMLLLAIYPILAKKKKFESDIDEATRKI